MKNILLSFSIATKKNEKKRKKILSYQKSVVHLQCISKLIHQHNKQDNNLKINQLN